MDDRGLAWMIMDYRGLLWADHVSRIIAWIMGYRGLSWTILHDFEIS